MEQHVLQRDLTAAPCRNKPHLMGIPIELRSMILELVIGIKKLRFGPRPHDSTQTPLLSSKLSVLVCCKKLREEALEVLYRKSWFVISDRGFLVTRDRRLPSYFARIRKLRIHNSLRGQEFPSEYGSADDNEQNKHWLVKEFWSRLTRIFSSLREIDFVNWDLQGSEHQTILALAYHNNQNIKINIYSNAKVVKGDLQAFPKGVPNLRFILSSGNRLIFRDEGVLKLRRLSRERLFAALRRALAWVQLSLEDVTLHVNLLYLHSISSEEKRLFPDQAWRTSIEEGKTRFKGGYIFHLIVHHVYYFVK